MKKIISIIIAVTLLSVYSVAQSVPKHEVRAVWITTIGGLDWPHSYSQSPLSAAKQQKEFCNILDKLKEANVNTVILQTRIRGTVIYPSEIEPWDGCLSGFPGRSPGYDALKFAVDECHKRGMEIHAWVVAIPVGKWNFLGCKRLRTLYPKIIRKIGDEGYMNPESELTADYIAKICAEITRNYDIDGINLDYIRYPETWKIRIPLDEGRKNITRIVRRVHDEVKAIKPWVKMACSPIGKYDDLSRYWSHGWNARNTVCQDAQAWLKDGLMDELFPMMYFQGDQFFPFAIDWKEQSHGKIIAPGLGIYFLDQSQKDWQLDIISREMNVLRQNGMGHAYFRSKFFTDNTKDIFNFASNEFDTYPAMVPAMTWESDKKPLAPTKLNVSKCNDKEIISWDCGKDMSGISKYENGNSTKSIPLFYNVYASYSYPVDINDARNIIAARIPANEIYIPISKGSKSLNYAVTSIDRYGNESKQTDSEKAAASESCSMIRNNGKILYLSANTSVFDAEFIIIQSLIGNIIATLPYKSNDINISNIPNGMYIVKSLNRRGYAHRIGMFIIKR